MRRPPLPFPRRVRHVLAAATAALGSVLVAGCAQASTGPAGVVQVVAAENFWGNIAAQIGGRDVRVTSLLSDPNADPHIFQTDAADAATLAQARVVVENGAGYDPWMGSLLASAGTHPHLVNAAHVLHVRGPNPNPHLWYDLPRVPTVAGAIARALSAAAPKDAASFRAHLAAFDASLAPLDATLATIRARFAGAPVAYTERVPGYLLARAGLRVRTPPGFAQAVEDGVDPSVANTQAMQNLLTGHRIDVLLYNVQAVSPVTTQVRALARQNAIPVVAVSETLPPRAQTYQQWQQSQLRALLHALERSPRR